MAFASRESLIKSYQAQVEANLTHPNKDALDTAAWWELEKQLWLQEGDKAVFQLLQNQIVAGFQETIMLYHAGDIDATTAKQMLKDKGILFYIQELKRIGLMSGTYSSTEIETYARKGIDLIRNNLPAGDMDRDSLNLLCSLVKNDFGELLRKVNSTLGVQALKDRSDVTDSLL